MGMGLVPPNDIRERQLIIGGMGTGKTNAICSIIERSPQTFFHIVDSDDAFEYQIVGGWPKILERGNYHIYEASDTDWQSIVDATETAAGKVTDPDDALVYDCFTDAWPCIQGHARAEGWWRLDKRDRPVEGDLDWIRVNSEFDRLYAAFKSIPGHLFVTADVEALSAERDAKEMRAVFGPFGVKPRGQKTMWRKFHTVLLLKRTMRDGWTISSVRERARNRADALDDVEFEDFAKTYMRGVAGWKMEKF